MEFEVVNSGEVVTNIIAKDERDAWKKLKVGGIRNRSGILSLIKI